MITFMLAEEATAENSLKEELFLELFDRIRKMCEIEEYLKKPIVKEGILARDEADEIVLDGDVLPAMTELEVFVYDEFKETFVWTRAFVGESDRKYLVGVGKDYDLNGVPARIRR